MRIAPTRALLLRPPQSPGQSQLRRPSPPRQRRAVHQLSHLPLYERSRQHQPQPNCWISAGKLLLMSPRPWLPPCTRKIAGVFTHHTAHNRAPWPARPCQSLPQQLCPSQHQRIRAQLLSPSVHRSQPRRPSHQLPRPQHQSSPRHRSAKLPTQCPGAPSQHSASAATRANPSPGG